MKKLIIVICSVFINQWVTSQQSQLYTQFGFNKLAVNPAYAGNNTYHSFTGIYRDQWNGFPGAPDAQMLTANLARFGNRVGVGFTLERQSIGITRKLQMVGNYAYKIPMKSGTLSGGLSVTLKNLMNDFTDPRLLAIQDINNDQAITIARLSKSFVNVGAGLYFNNEKFFAGIATPGLIKNDLELSQDMDDIVSQESRQVFLMGGGILPINTKLDFKPQVLLRWIENGPLSVDLNVGLLYDKKYHTAVTYRSGGNSGSFGESIDLMLGLQMSDQLLIGFAYDFTMSDLRNHENGSIELLIKYRMVKTEKQEPNMANPRYF